MGPLGRRFDVFPDGGISRLRVLGSVVGDSRRSLGVRWFNALPESQAAAIVADVAEVSAAVAQQVVAARPLPDTRSAATAIVSLLPDPEGPGAERLAALVHGRG